MLTKIPIILLCALTAFLVFNSAGSSAKQQPAPGNPTELRQNDPLSYALVYARKTNNQFALSEIAIRYAKLGDFDQAIRVNESTTDEDWRTGAFGEIALEYWKQGRKEEAQQLFLRVAGMPLPKDVIYIWGPTIERMASAEQFEPALDTVAAMAAAGGTTAGAMLEKVVEDFVEAKSRKPTLPDILPRVVSIARTLDTENYPVNVLKEVAVAYVARGEVNRAIKMIERFDKDYDQPDARHQIAIALAKLGRYEQGIRLADQAGDFFSDLALVQIASEAVQRRDLDRARAMVTRFDALLTRRLKAVDYEPAESDAKRLCELSTLYLKLSRRDRAVDLAELAFKTAKGVGKPGERYGALQSACAAYSELGLYDRAIQAAAAIDYDRSTYSLLAEIGEHAQQKGRLDAVAGVVKFVQDAKPSEHEELRLKALIRIARAGADQGRAAAGGKLLETIEPLIDRLEYDEDVPEILKDYAVAFAAAGNIRVALERIPKIQSPYFITWALIDIAMLPAGRELVANANHLAVLNEIVGADLPPEAKPEKLIRESGWQIPGLANARMLRPPELQAKRNRAIELYYTFYEPEVETFMERPFPSRRKPKPKQEEWVSEGIKVSLIEEHTIKGRRFCYRLTGYEVFRDKATGMPKYADNLESIFFYDEDGDGTFETMEEGLSYFGSGRIPKWALEN